METFDDLYALFDSDPSIATEEDQISRRGEEGYLRKNNRVVKGFVARVDHIMRNHAGTGIIKFRVQPPLGFYIDPAVVDRWSAAIMEQPGIKDFELELAPVYDDDLYSFPCSLLLLSTTTIASHTLSGCSFRSFDSLAAGSSLTSLTRVHLHNMRVTTEQVRCFLSSCPSLEDLTLSCCHQMVCFEMPPRLLPRLKSLLVYSCSTLLTVRCDAPKAAEFPISTSWSCVRDMKIKSIDEPGMLCYAATELQLPTVAPNLSALFLSSCFETADTPMVIGKFRHLTHLDIHIREASRCPDYDFCSLVSLLDASPSLDTFILTKKVAAAGGGGHRHPNLKTVLISGFCSAKGMIELTGHILDNSASLELLVLDTSYGRNRRSRCKRINSCSPLTMTALMEARKALQLIKRYIQGQPNSPKVPSTVKFGVLGPCTAFPFTATAPL
ncbi:hypothetical protein BS78_05G025400 [Paspalum vaginatum]|nr:hypothetical protein BS78_05G025400 [Paspalum vaginatum]